MTTIIDCVHTDGKLVPRQPLHLQSHEPVSLGLITQPKLEISDEEFDRLAAACVTVDDLIQLDEFQPDDDGSYQIEKWLAEESR